LIELVIYETMMQHWIQKLLFLFWIICSDDGVLLNNSSLLIGSIDELLVEISKNDHHDMLPPQTKEAMMRWWVVVTRTIPRFLWAYCSVLCGEITCQFGLRFQVATRDVLVNGLMLLHVTQVQNAVPPLQLMRYKSAYNNQ